MNQETQKAKKTVQNANGNVQIRQAWKFLKIFIVKTTKLNKYEKEIKKQLQVHSMQCNILHYSKISLNYEQNI